MNSQNFEKLGSFYLGRDYDLQSKQILQTPTLYDSKDLVTHGVVLGMTGSGKTGLCLSILEEAAMDNIPAIIIDPKGDIANLMLTFPDFQGKDFEPWINQDDARKKGVSAEVYAERTARMWKKGIEDWGQSPERVAQLQDKVDIHIFTPGSQAGLPVSILSSLKVPALEILDDGELLGDCIENTVSSLLSLIGVDADPIQSPDAILLSHIFLCSWQNQKNLTLEAIIRQIQSPAFDKVGIIDLESFMNKQSRQKLALKFNALLASPGFASWMQGPALNIDSMLHAANGKPRISIFSIAHLSDSERMFFVSLLLNQMLGWMRTQSGTTSLRSLLYMDEIYGYLPPSQNPPSKKPMMTMLKQGRAFGLGILLATQNPVDLDYKALSNIGTWWLGRLQTERDKARVLDGLEGAASSQEGQFDRPAMEQLLAGLSSRVFLMNNVHDSSPVVFHVRWVMSYLCGPLTRRKIKRLMDPKRHLFPSARCQNETTSKQNDDSHNPMLRSHGMVKKQSPGNQPRPLVGHGVTEYFLPPDIDTKKLTYLPAFLQQANVHFSSSKYGIDGSRLFRRTHAINPEGIDWHTEINCPYPLESLAKQPHPDARFSKLPGYAMNSRNYTQAKKEFIQSIYQNERVTIYHCPLLKNYSRLNENETTFRARLSQQAREFRDQAVEKLRDKYEAKINTKLGQRQRAEHRLAREEAEASSASWQTGAKILEGLLGSLLGGRRPSSSSTVTSATRAYKQRGDVKRAEQKIASIDEDINQLEAELQQDIKQLDNQFDPVRVKLSQVAVKPYKKDIHVDCVALLWLPHDSEGQPLW